MISSKHLLHGHVELGAPVHQGLELGGDVVEGLGQDRVDGDHGPGDGLKGPRRPELEAVAGEGERTGPVTVAGVSGQDREGVDADGQRALLLGALGPALGDLVEDVGELVAQEDRDDGGWCFVGPQAMVVGGGGHRCPQQPAELVHGPDDGAAEDQELGVLVGCVTRQEQVALCGIADARS